MPNWVVNSVEITAPASHISAMKELLTRTENGDNDAVFSFANIIPLGTDMSGKIMDPRDAWGTKWDVVCQDPDDDEAAELVTDEERFLLYTFTTAGTAPVPVLRRLSEMFPESVILHEWDEETGFGGIIEYVEGHDMEVHSWDNSTSHAQRLYKGLECLCVVEGEIVFPDCLWHLIDLVQAGHQLCEPLVDGLGSAHVRSSPRLPVLTGEQYTVAKALAERNWPGTLRELFEAARKVS